MSGSTTRDKGRRGQTAALNLLRSRDWTVADLSSGISCEDGLAICPDGIVYAVEIKNTANILQSHRNQAMRQARDRGKNTRWMLMNRITGTASWLVQRQGERPAVWHEGEGRGG